MKSRKKEYYGKLKNILNEIKSIYDKHKNILGHRQMVTLLEKINIKLSKTTVHKYMNKILGLYSIVFCRKRKSVVGEHHKIFDNFLNQKFHVDAKNKIYCIDFTYIKLANGKTIYNCSIIDLYDRYIVGHANGTRIDNLLAIEALQNASKNENIKAGLILHSDQGSQFTSLDLQNIVNLKI